jgi:hypothetical protein
MTGSGGLAPDISLSAAPEGVSSPATGRPGSRGVAVRRMCKVDRTYTSATCHPAPGGGPDRRTVDVYVLSTVHKIRSTAARALTRPHPPPMPRASHAGAATGTTESTGATGDAGWSLQVGSSPQTWPPSAPSATPTHTSVTRAGYPLVLWVAPSHTNGEGTTPSDIPSCVRALVARRCMPGAVRAVRWGLETGAGGWRQDMSGDGSPRLVSSAPMRRLVAIAAGSGPGRRLRGGSRGSSGTAWSRAFGVGL